MSEAQSDETRPPLVRLTQPDWCNAPQPHNWHHACMRAPGHEGAHAVRKTYRLDEAWTWPAHGGGPVNYVMADRFPDLWDLRADHFDSSEAQP